MPKNAPPPPDEPTIYQLKVTLKDSTPPIWRRIQVPADFTLDVLHLTLQLAMGWENSHLHQFIIDGKSYTMPDEEGTLEHGDFDEADFTLEEVAPNEKAKLVYEYDFGDGWDHTIVVEKILPLAPDVEYPICLDGARACPPDDSGGIHGYQAKLEVVADPNHPEYEDTVEWMGDDWDAEAFSVEETNDALSELEEYIAEMEMLADLDPEEIMSMLMEGVEVLKSSIQQVRRLSNGVVLDLPYDPQAIASAFQFILFQHPQMHELKFSLNLGPNDSANLQITGPKELMTDLENILGLAK